MATYQSKFTINRRRKGFLSVAVPWLKRFGIVLLIAVVSFWAGSWFFLSGSAGRTGNWVDNKIVEATASMGFAVENILVEGRVNTDPEILKAVIAVQKGDPLFSFNPDSAREEIKKINWVRDAHVERRLPGTVYVKLEERQPLALFQRNNQLELLDQDGGTITKENLGKFKNLLIVMGEGAPARTPDLLKNLNAEPVLLKRMKAAKWLDRRWDLVFDNGATAKLPEGEIGLAMRRLGQAQEQDAILDKAILSVDLREQGRMIVQTAPGAAQEYKSGAKESNI